VTVDMPPIRDEVSGALGVGRPTFDGDFSDLPDGGGSFSCASGEAPGFD
jgi:hypothetical protein